VSDGAPRPYTLVAELTYRCPLRCVYCSNPLDYASHRDALGTADWLRVFREAEALGVVQLNLTGGEPLVRDDLEAMVEAARGLDLYTNLITSGIPCTARAAGGAAGPRSRQRAGVGAGRPGAGIGPHRRPPVLRAQDRGGAVWSRSWGSPSRSTWCSTART
jgi:pyrroloquinoline quinone biosynthesis protein E